MAAATRDRIIHTAHDMFYAMGFHAVGLGAIIGKAGVTKTTFYNHFESKDQLVSEVLNWHDRWWQDTFRQTLRELGGSSARGQLMAVPDVLEQLCACGDFNGCFFVNVAVQFPAKHDPAHQAAVTHKRAMEAILQELACYADADDAEALAKEISLVLEGAYVTLQVSTHPRTIELARSMITMLVDRRCGG